MCSKKLHIISICLALIPFLCVQAFALGAKPDTETVKVNELDKAPTASISLEELAHIYWPDSGATQLQQEETLTDH